MTIDLTIDRQSIHSFYRWVNGLPWFIIAYCIVLVLSSFATISAFKADTIVAYGDSESHLNIAKRVVHTLTPGLAQLGGIWLPLPHVLMVPFVYFDWLWRTGLAGAIVSGISYVIAALFIFKLTYLLTKNSLTAFVAFLVFSTNPNMLYMQSTPLTELPLIAFFVLSTYYFIKHLFGEDQLVSLILAAFFGLCASLTRYDGWFLVLVEAGLLLLVNSPLKSFLVKLKQGQISIPKIITAKGEGIFILFGTLAFFGILLWLGWDWLILGNPLYFTTSRFSAASQQAGWLAKGQLPAYHNLPLSFVYYLVTSMSLVGILSFGVAIVGLGTLFLNRNQNHRWLLIAVLMIPFMFYVLTLYIGQSMIFIPHLTPITFEWRLFNVRYGLMMVPTCAFLSAYLFHKSKSFGRIILILLFVLQLGLYPLGYSKVMALEDGTVGLSSGRRPDAENWLAHNYDTGLVLMDDYSRIFSVIRSSIPMQNIIYIGNKPYWEESLTTPEKWAKWVIIQKGDTLWKTFYETKAEQDRFYSQFTKVYTSEEILIFKLSKSVAVAPL